MKINNIEYDNDLMRLLVYATYKGLTWWRYNIKRKDLIETAKNKGILLVNGEFCIISDLGFEFVEKYSNEIKNNLENVR